MQRNSLLQNLYDTHNTVPEGVMKELTGLLYKRFGGKKTVALLDAEMVRLLLVMISESKTAVHSARIATQKRLVAEGCTKSGLISNTTNNYEFIIFLQEFAEICCKLFYSCGKMYQGYNINLGLQRVDNGAIVTVCESQTCVQEAMLLESNMYHNGFESVVIQFVVDLWYGFSRIVYRKEMHVLNVEHSFRESGLTDIVMVLALMNGYYGDIPKTVSSEVWKCEICS